MLLSPPPPLLLPLPTRIPPVVSRCSSHTCQNRKTKNHFKKNPQNKTLDGGSLGSSVDEERGQPRELMRIAGLSEHRHLERTLRLRDPLSRGPVRSRGGKWHVFFLNCEETSCRPRKKVSSTYTFLSFWERLEKRRKIKRVEVEETNAMETGKSQVVVVVTNLRLPLADRGVAPIDRV